MKIGWFSGLLNQRPSSASNVLPWDMAIALLLMTAAAAVSAGRDSGETYLRARWLYAHHTIDLGGRM